MILENLGSIEIVRLGKTSRPRTTREDCMSGSNFKSDGVSSTVRVISVIYNINFASCTLIAQGNFQRGNTPQKHVPSYDVPTRFCNYPLRHDLVGQMMKHVSEAAGLLSLLAIVSGLLRCSILKPRELRTLNCPLHFLAIET